VTIERRIKSTARIASTYSAKIIPISLARVTSVSLGKSQRWSSFS
jgi:hypothetical protein